MKVYESKLSGVFLLEPVKYEDSRGSFSETFRADVLECVMGERTEFVQENTSISHKDVLRGLHFQRAPFAQSKLVTVFSGSVLDVVVDMRASSSTFGQVEQFVLSGENRRQLFIPKGFAHGFLSLRDQTLFHYKVDAYYNPGSEAGIAFDDPFLGISWGVEHQRMLVSEKDKVLPKWADIDSYFF